MNGRGPAAQLFMNERSPTILLWDIDGTLLTTARAGIFALEAAARALLLRFRPDEERITRFVHAAMRRCYPGAPVLVDDSDENAVAIARVVRRRPTAPPDVVTVRASLSES